MSVGRDYKKSNWKNNSKPQVRRRALLVITLVSIGLFASALAYIKTNKPASRAEVTRTKPKPADESAANSDQKSKKPQYDYYKELRQREIIIRKDELGSEKSRKLKDSAQSETRTAKAKAENKPKNKPAEKPRQAAATAARIPAGNRRAYLIQAGAFSQPGDAEKVKAKLALLGIRARVVKGSTKGNRVIHRVRIGPINSDEQVQAMRAQLDSNNIKSIAIRLD